MNKKRFIKLMMARGYSRNTATAMAAQVSRYGSYSTLARVLPDVIRGLYAGLAALGDSMATAFSNFAESMRRAADG